MNDTSRRINLYIFTGIFSIIVFAMGGIAEASKLDNANTIIISNFSCSMGACNFGSLNGTWTYSAGGYIDGFAPYNHDTYILDGQSNWQITQNFDTTYVLRNDNYGMDGTACDASDDPITAMTGYHCNLVNTAGSITMDIAVGGGGGGGGESVAGIGDLMTSANNTFSSTTGFTVGSIVSWSADNLIKLFLGSALAVLLALRYWIVALVMISLIVYFAYRAFRFFRT